MFFAFALCVFALCFIYTNKYYKGEDNFFFFFKLKIFKNCEVIVFCYFCNVNIVKYIDKVSQMIDKINL